MKNTRKRNKVRLTESQLHKVIKESVRKMLNEDENYSDVLLDDILDMFYTYGKRNGWSENDIWRTDTLKQLLDVGYMSKEGSYLVNKYIESLGGLENCIEKEKERVLKEHVYYYVGMLKRMYDAYEEPTGFYQGEPYWGLQSPEMGRS